MIIIVVLILPDIGTDETVFTILEVTAEGTGYVIYIEATAKMPITDTVGRLKDMFKHFNFRMVYADETGLGGGAVDMIREAGIPITPITFTLQVKHNMYHNLKNKMEQNNLKFKIVNQKLLNQLGALQYEYTSSGFAKLHAPERGHDDYPDSLALACLGLLSEPLGLKTFSEETMKKWEEFLEQ